MNIKTVCVSAFAAAMLAFGVQAEEKLDVVVVYYPHWHRYPLGDQWFGPKWKQAEWNYVKTQKQWFPGQINFRPYAGWLSGADPEDVATEIDLASNAGITVFLYDYYWYNGTYVHEEAIEQGFLKAKNRDKMKFALMWCYHERTNGWRKQKDVKPPTLLSLAHTPEEFLAFIDHSIARYFNQPEYWRKDGKLFFSIYNFKYLWETWGKDDAKVKNALAEARRRVRAAGLGEMHFNAQNVPPKMMKQFAALGLDSFTRYNASSVKDQWQRYGKGERLFDYGEMDGYLQETWAQNREASPIPFIPTVSTGWDSTYRCRSNTPFPWQGKSDYPYCATLTNNTDVLFEKYLRAAKESVLADPKKPGAVYINAWNEYTEGCWLLPDMRRGDLKLRAVARVFGRHPADKYAYTGMFHTWEGDKAKNQHAHFIDVPTIENLKYGPHERQGVDVWLPKSRAAGAKSSTVIVIHGGGWSGGDRIGVSGWLKECQKRGYVLATVGYRFIQDGKDLGIKPPVKACLDDAVAAIEMIKSHADEWGIDVKRIGLTGGSAGACSSLYCSLQGDNALGINAVFAEYPQTSLDPAEMREWIPNSNYGAGAFGYSSFQKWFDHRAECLDQINRYSPAALLRKSTPARAATLFYGSVQIPPPKGLAKDPTHSPIFCVKFEEIAKSKGINCKFAKSIEFLDHLAK